MCVCVCVCVCVCGNCSVEIIPSKLLSIDLKVSHEHFRQLIRCVIVHAPENRYVSPVTGFKHPIRTENIKFAIR